MRQFWSLPDEEQCRRLSTNSLLTLLDCLGTDDAARLLLLLWRTWQVRNNITHGSEKLSVEGSLRFLQRYSTELCSIRQQGHFHILNGKQPVYESLIAEKYREGGGQKFRWSPPQEGWLKVNVDGAFSEETGEGGIGVIVHDCLGAVQLSSWQFVQNAASAEEVEALACKEGMRLVAEWGQQSTILETDWKVVHKRRESNRVAHELAQLAKRTKHSAVWRFAIPVCVEHLIAQDCNCVSE
ncbi:hypothetical protein HU200_003355 [Digitaria exilis]|uniref:RNase H type-1 domain-containing protein n=1 Tax=Digitaria exilis TaxID=1010633 RepID=A0A835FVA7_9POAL|nr:hypothetical protein HU200_003355 [Digitaria exilis]